MKTLNTLANVAIIVSCSIAAVAFGVDAWRKATWAKTPVRQVLEVVKSGDLLSALSDVDFTRAKQTLVVVVSSGCRYCAESMPFYRSLVAKAASQPGALALVVVSRQPVQITRQYLLDQKVDIAALRSVAPGHLRVPGTPSLILVDGNRTVRRVWFGLLDVTRQNEVFDSAFSGTGRSAPTGL